MAPPAQAQVDFEPAEGPFDLKNGDFVGDDWVSLVLSDVGADTEADNPISVASLSSLPLPDLPDVDFSNIDGSVSSHGFCSSFEQGPLSGSDVLFDPSEILQSTEMHPNLYKYDQDFSGGHPYACPSSSHFCNVEKENAFSQSPESGISHESSEYPDANTNIPVMESCSSEDSFYFLVSDICSEEISSIEAKSCNVVNEVAGHASFQYPRVNGNHDSLADVGGQLHSSGSQQKSSIVSEEIDMCVGKRDNNKKRKHLDRTSRSSTPEGVSVDCVEKPIGGAEVKDEEDEKRQARLMRNRESAQLSRQRKKLYVDELEEKIKTMASTIAELNNTVNLISAENINLRRQLGMFGPSGQAGGLSPVAPWMGAYPPGPMVGSRFMAPGSQVPLVPIPKWKSQQVTTVKKTRKPKLEPQEKGGSEKGAKKTKKVAGVAAVGLFFFMFILVPFNLRLLGFRPIMQRNTKVWPTNPLHMEATNVVVRAGGRVLTGLNEESSSNAEEQGSGMAYTHLGALTIGGKELDQKLESYDTRELNVGDHRPGYKKNSSIPLAATLFVPRNDQLVRIEGNLIINSVLAGNKASEFLNQSEKQRVKSPAMYDRSLALNANLKAVALKAAPEEKRALVELHKALAGRLRFDLDGGDIKTVKEDGSLQQWFVEDFTGPIFSSGVCTEVFQFEISPAVSSPSSGSTTHVRDANDILKNKTAWMHDNGPRKAGRASYAVPLPPIGHREMFNATSSNSSFSSTKGGYGANHHYAKQKPASSSVVVSVLAGPELGEPSKLTGGRKLSRIFVVVLIDSIKYVTYSCMLPSSAAKAHYEVVVP